LASASVAHLGFVRRGGIVALTAQRRHRADAQQCDGSVLPGAAPRGATGNCRSITIGRITSRPALPKALTVIHHYVITRRDGTTAAERFATKKHENLFAHLVAITPTPARPRVRSRKAVEPMLVAA
jgi:hypothetical protein